MCIFKLILMKSPFLAMYAIKIFLLKVI
ncbi:unnamed protein product [Larinioides sclopetarius]|uniref:NADH dehydrogenase subunit 1 n=1 Tax=Larinioides sclopetarius TaxID=280406 RepID=A0AAV2BP77_9ARAC